jgi:molecular chaperone HscB
MNPFEQLGLPVSFLLAQADIDRAYREKQRALTRAPISDGGGVGRAQLATSLNEALQTTSDPVRRSEAIFADAGVALGDAVEPKPSPDFLMAMLDAREALANARQTRETSHAEALLTKTAANILTTLQALEVARNKAELTGAVGTLGQLRYLCRLAEDARDAVLDTQA